MLRKFIFFLALGLAISFSACNTEEGEVNPTNNTKFDTTEGREEGSIVEIFYEGLELESDGPCRSWYYKEVIGGGVTSYYKFMADCGTLEHRTDDISISEKEFRDHAKVKIK